jgi:broad specificity phosphatase PhoE
MIVHLLRHGQTSMNRDGLGLGRRDVPLTDFGLRQSELAAEALGRHPIEAVFASSLSRAMVAAEMVAANAGVEVGAEEALVELDVGETEGVSFPELRARFPEFMERWRGPDVSRVTMPGGESLDDVNQRLEPFLRSLQGSGFDEVAIVSHNFVLRLLICRWLGLPVGAFRNFELDLASITTVVTGPPVALRRLNDTCHLRSLEPSVKQT